MIFWQSLFKPRFHRNPKLYSGVVCGTAVALADQPANLKFLVLWWVGLVKNIYDMRIHKPAQKSFLQGNVVPKKRKRNNPKGASVNN